MINISSEKRNELLKTFGLLMDSDYENYDIYSPSREWYAKTNDSRTLFNGYSFYVNVPKMTPEKAPVQKQYQLDMLDTTQGTLFSSMSLKQLKEPNIYEIITLEATAISSNCYLVSEKDYKLPAHDVVSNISYSVIDKLEKGHAHIKIHNNDKSVGIVDFDKDELTGEIIPSFRNEYAKTGSLDKMISLIESSIMFKSILSILSPEVYENYEMLRKNTRKSR